MDKKTTLIALSAIAHEARLDIFRCLVQAGAEGLAAGVISERLSIPNSTLSFHLKELSHANLVTARQESRFVFYSANYETMNTMLAYLTENCCAGEPQACFSTACCPPTSAVKGQ